MTSTAKILVLTLSASCWAVGAEAQLAITSPANGATLKAGADHFTDVVGDPMDFTNVDDFMSESLGTAGWAGGGPTLSNGRLTGTTTGGDNGVTLVHPGFLQGSLNLHRFFGTDTPLDTSRFQRLSFRIKSSNAAEVPGIYIYREPIPGTGVGTTVYQPGGYGVTTDRIFNLDLTTAPAAGPGWTSTSQAVGLRLDPNEAQNIMTMELDWLRFTVANTSAEAVSTPIAWTGATAPVTVELLDAAGTVLLETIASNLSGGAFTWFHGYLAPGPYRLRVRDSRGLSATVSITVNDPPVINLTNPDQSGGEDWATAVKGNAWDMSSVSDVVLSNNVNGLTSDGAVLKGTSPNGNGDPGLFLARDDPDGIASSYHRLTFRMRLNTAFDLGAGSVARILFGDVINSFTSDVFSTTQDIVLFDDFQTYVVDLSTLQFTTGLEPGVPANYKTWDQMGTIRQFRLDPHEFPTAVEFEIDDVKLAKDDETVGGLFGITWTVTDADAGDAPTVMLEYDNDTNATNGTLGQIATGVAAVSRGSFSWDANGIPAGLYYIRATVSDGTNSQSRYSTGPVRVTTTTLSVTVNGSGTVTSSPAGITCPGTCSATLGLGRVVTLTPTQALGFVFAGWSGDADCSDGVVTMSTDRACTAQFNQAPPATLTVTKTGAGAGTVTSSPPGISCGSDCAQTYVNGTMVTLTPAPAAGSAFSGWTGDADCDDGIVTMFSARTCTARFETAISATDVLMGQEPTRFSITGASPERVFRFAARGGRSYCVEVTNTDDGRGGALVQADPSISVFADGAAVQLIEANDNLVTEPVGRFQSRACFVAPASTIPMDGRIRVSDKSPGTAYYVLRIVETTLWASWFFQGGDFNSFVLMRNTTDGSCSFTITWRDPSGTVVGSSGLQSVGAHGGVGLNSRSFVPAVSVNGTVAVAHDCSPEALIGQLTSLSGEQGINFDSALFQRRPW